MSGPKRRDPARSGPGRSSGSSPGSSRTERGPAKPAPARRGPTEGGPAKPGPGAPRIVAGRHRGRKLLVPPGPAVRPTAERAREALFNILLHGAPASAAEDGGGLDGRTVIDAFAGSGALGLEALSRGARHATFIERDRDALAALRRNVATLGETANATVLALDAARLPPPPRAPGLPADLVFLDPPYGEGLAGPALAHLGGRRWLKAGCRCVVEIGAKETFAPPPGFALLERRTYGAAQILFLVWRPAMEPDPERECVDA